MGLDDLVSTESAIVATVTAAVFSPRTRETLRRGAVLGVAGALKAGDVVAGAARGVARGVRGEGTADGAETANGAEAPEPALQAQSAPPAHPAPPAQSPPPVKATRPRRPAAVRTRTGAPAAPGPGGTP
jgi:hypothetical protein